MLLQALWAAVVAGLWWVAFGQRQPYSVLALDEAGVVVDPVASKG